MNSCATARLDARNFFDYGSIPQFQRNVFGGSLGGPIKKDKSFLFVNYEGFRQNLGLSDLTLVPDAASRASAVASVQPLLALWPAANGPELLTSTGAPSGIAEAFSNPLQHVREDFGTARFDQTLSDKDSFAAVYTVDDSTAHSPGNNPFTLDRHFPARAGGLASARRTSSRPRCSIAPRFGFSRGGFYFNSGTTVSLPAGSIPASPSAPSSWAAAQRSTEPRRSPTAARTPAATSARHATYLPSPTRSRSRTAITCSISAYWFERLQSNDSLVQDQYGQISFSSLQTFIQQGLVSTYTYAPVLHATGLALFRRRFLRGGHHQAEALDRAARRLSRRIHQRLERGARPSVELRLRFGRRDSHAACGGQLRARRQ